MSDTITVPRAVLEQALEALESVDGAIVALLGSLAMTPDADAPGAAVRQSITALRTALAELQDEPVAWRYKAMVGMPWSLSDDGYYVSCKRDRGYIVEPLIVKKGQKMTDLRTAAKKLVDLLDNRKPFTHRDDWLIACRVARDALRAALAGPVQEPVAWMYPDDYERMASSETFCTVFSVECSSPTHGQTTIPLYTHPPRREPLGEAVAAELERVANEAPISGNELARARVLLSAAQIRGGDR